MKTIQKCKATQAALTRLLGAELDESNAWPIAKIQHSASQERTRQIREAAYFKAMKRHLKPGHELDDWLSAEREVDQALIYWD